MKNNSLISLLLIFLIVLLASYHCQAASCKNFQEPVAHIDYKIPDSAHFRTMTQDKPVHLYTLKNKNNALVAITNYGARIVSILVPDKNNIPTDVVLGYDSIKAYQGRGDAFFGAVVGRYGNRIAKAKFDLDGKTYSLDLNNGANSLHGGIIGFHTRVFDAKQINKQTLQLTYLSKDGEGGFPGNLTAIVTYTLGDDNSLKIEYNATTDKATVVNLTNHSYFNLNGVGTKTITNDQLKIDADNYLPVTASSIPTAEIRPVKGTPFDFTNLKLIDADIHQTTDDQVKIANGYDHCFILNKHTIKQAIATVKSPETGITMEVFTDQPALQLYSGNGLNGRRATGKSNATYGFQSALCLETEHYPDSPNQPSFPSTTLKPGEKYHTVTIYKFSNK